MDDFKTQKISDYCRRRNFETFQKIDLSEKTFFLKTLNLLLKITLNLMIIQKEKKFF